MIVENVIMIFCHGHRVNHLNELFENQSVQGVTIVVQTLCDLMKEIMLTISKNANLVKEMHD